MNVADTQEDRHTQAITVLTAAARQTRTTMGGQVEPDDFAAFLAQVVTAVAANVGGIEALLAGRPGSWEADLVRRLVQGAAGDDLLHLMRWRTDPIRVVLDLDEVLGQILGLDGMELDELVAVENDAGELPDEDEAGYDRAMALAEAIERVWRQDKTAYAQAYTATVRQLVADRYGPNLTVEVTVVDATTANQPTQPWDEFGEWLREEAIRHTPLPMTGTPPDWTNGDPVAALRAAGLTYTARAQATVDGGPHAHH